MSALTSAQAETRQFGNVIYEIPEGWSLGGTREHAQILLSDKPDDACEYCYMYIGREVPASGTLDQFLNDARTTFIDEEDRADAKVMADPVFFDLGGQQAGLVALLAGNYLHIFGAVELDDRFQSFGFEGGADGEEEMAESMAAFQNDFTAMMDGARFVSAGAPSLLPEAVPGDLSGLWWGTETAWEIGLDGMTHMEIYHTHLMFWPDGHFYRGTPPQGTVPLDRAALMAAADTDFGTYTRSGDTLTLTFADGDVETATIDGTGIAIGATTTHPVELLQDGETIEGTISSFSYTGFTPGSGVQGGASASSYTTFRKNGSYEGESSGGAFGNFEGIDGQYTGGFTTGSGDATGGTYEIRDGLIVSTPNDGSAPRMVLVFRAGDEILVGQQFLTTE